MSAYNDTIYSYTPPGPKILFAQLPAFSTPQGLAFDSSGNLFAAGGNVYKITPEGTVSLFATLPPFNSYQMVIDRGYELLLPVTRLQRQWDESKFQRHQRKDETALTPK